MYKKVPKALFNSKALFNPYQYLPFNKMMSWNDNDKRFITNGTNVLVTDEVGVGKTFEIGIILRELLHWNTDLTVLILCPVKLCENWKKELYDNFYIGATNYYQEKTFGQITIIPYSYFSSKKSKSISEDIKNEGELRKEKCEAEQESLQLTEELSNILPYDILMLRYKNYHITLFSNSHIALQDIKSKQLDLYSNAIILLELFLFQTFYQRQLHQLLIRLFRLL